MTASFKAITRK